jgi:hypothetical protein
MTELTVVDKLSIRRGASLWFSKIRWLRLLGPLSPGVRMSGEFAAGPRIPPAGGVR